MHLSRHLDISNSLSLSCNIYILDQRGVQFVLHIRSQAEHIKTHYIDFQMYILYRSNLNTFASVYYIRYIVTFLSFYFHIQSCLHVISYKLLSSQALKVVNATKYTHLGYVNNSIFIASIVILSRHFPFIIRHRNQSKLMSL